MAVSNCSGEQVGPSHFQTYAQCLYIGHKARTSVAVVLFEFIIELTTMR